MLKELVDFLQKESIRKPRILLAHESQTEETKLVVGPEICEVRTYPRPEVEREHQFETLPGFLAFLKNADHCPVTRPLLAAPVTAIPRRGVVFVGAAVVTADLAYGEHTEQRASLRLNPTDAFSGLLAFSQGLGVKEAWRLLTTGLAAPALSVDLLGAISSLRVSASKKMAMDIDASGLMSEQGGRSIDVTWEKDGTRQTDAVGVDWTWKGRIWRCFEKEYKINTRLELEADEDAPLRIYLHPELLGEVLDKARGDLAHSIQADLPGHFSAFEGTF